jgi:hypothetical protein
VQIAPDWFASLIFAGCFASVGVFAYAAASGAFAFVEALVWVIALINLVGCVAALYEALLTRLLHDNEAARGGAAILTLVSVCVALGTVMHSITSVQTAETSMVARLGVRVLTWSAPVSTLVGFLLLVVCAGGWLLFSSLTAREVLRRFGRTPWIRSERGGLAALSVLSFLRDSSNRLGLLAVCVMTIFSIWLDRWLGLGVGPYITLWTGCVYISASAILSYGDFVQLRWRVAVAPARGRIALAKWFAGHLAAAAGPIILLILVVNAAGWQPLAASLVTSPDVVLVGVPVGVSGGLLAGCIVPYEKEDMLAIATSGVLAGALAAGSWLLCRWVSSSTAIPAVVWAMLLLAAAAILCLVLRGPRQGQPQGLLAGG